MAIASIPSALTLARTPFYFTLRLAPASRHTFDVRHLQDQPPSALRWRMTTVRKSVAFYANVCEFRLRDNTQSLLAARNIASRA
jgi:hypothetical protein